ncbi:TRAP transporter small permease [Azospirillum halopraeferens]|uniref:TRAP transporter small permease n=1 Tax=Azospirillum halopraeferens TaxID=34010 RepID=UPI00041956F0|nr:TRAP transporter small permease [Azospirillum halopraeferens]
MLRTTARLAAGWSRLLARAEMFVCKALIVVFTALLIVNVGLRYLFNAPLFYAEELAIYILIWMAFLAISVTIHENVQVRMTLFSDRLTYTRRRTLFIVTETVAALMLAAILYHSVHWILSPFASFDMAVTLGWPKWPFFLIIPLFSAAALCHVLAHLLRAIAEAAGVVPDPATEPS